MALQTALAAEFGVENHFQQKWQAYFGYSEGLANQRSNAEFQALDQALNPPDEGVRVTTTGIPFQESRATTVSEGGTARVSGIAEVYNLTMGVAGVLQNAQLRFVDTDPIQPAWLQAPLAVLEFAVI